MLALLNQPPLAVLVTGPSGGALENRQLNALLCRMATWPDTAEVNLLLAPDVQRSTHPGNALEPRQRPLGELTDGRSPEEPWDPGALIRWS